jgi:hypothetical protein
MSSGEVVDQRRLLILDTGPIRELIAYQAVNELGFRNLRRELTHLVNTEAHRNCGIFLSSFRKKLTSASVVGELNSWIRNTPTSGQRHLWQLAHEEFRNMGLDEGLIRFLDMDLDLVAKYGPTDVSLLEIARQNLGQRPVVLTLDSHLYGECWNAQIDSQLLGQVCGPAT